MDVRPEPADTNSDIFDSSLNLEDAHFKEGYDDGHSHGVAAGKEEGHHVGLKTGFETGEELGFYRGCIGVWNSSIGVDPTRYSTRVQKSVRTMEVLLDEHPMMEPEDERAQEMMGDLRLKFRAICASLGVKLEYRGYLKGVDNKDVRVLKALPGCVWSLSSQRLMLYGNSKPPRVVFI